MSLVTISNTQRERLATAVIYAAVAVFPVACEGGDPAPETDPAETAAGALRPVGDVQLLAEAPPPEPRRDVPLVPDSKLEWTIQKAIADAGLDVRVTVLEQRVTLTGRAGAEQRAAAEAIARRTEGVRAIYNDIEVR